MDRSRRILDAILHIHEAPLTPGGWAQTLPSIAAVSGSDVAVMLIRDAEGRRGDQAIGVHSAPEQLAAFAHSMRNGIAPRLAHLPAHGELSRAPLQLRIATSHDRPSTTRSFNREAPSMALQFDLRTPRDNKSFLQREDGWGGMTSILRMLRRSASCCRTSQPPCTSARGLPYLAYGQKRPRTPSIA